MVEIPNSPAAHASYTHGHHASVLRSHEWRTAENSAGYLLEHLRGGQSLLDVGCGPGTITADLAGRLAPGRVVGVDSSAEVIERARQSAAEPGGRRLEFAVGDVYALDFPDDSFDVVHAHQVLQHLADPVAALRELRRVCRPGGAVAVRDADYAAFAWFPQLPELDEWLELYRTIARGNGGEPDAGRRLLSWARAAGFPDGAISAGGSAWCFADPADRTWWGGMWRDRMLESGIARQVVDEGHAQRADLERISAAWAGWAADPDGWMSVPHGELICRA
jgi:SAM-dependent methyltransferase